jgi:hypothetical protein
LPRADWASTPHRRSRFFLAEEVAFAEERQAEGQEAFLEEVGYYSLKGREKRRLRENLWSDPEPEYPTDEE